MFPRIVFFGNERLGTGLTTTAPTLRHLIWFGCEIAAVIVAQKDEGNSRKERPLEVVEIAKEHNIPVLVFDKLKPAVAEIAALKAELGVLVAYGKIVPQEVIDIFPAGIVNIHPSLLPKHRGPTPIESVIRNGDTETGVSLMKLVAAMDAGPVYDQMRIPLTGSETKQELADALADHAWGMLIFHLRDIIAGRSQPKPQDDELATYDSLITKADGAIDATKTADVLAREVRAYAVWPRSTTAIGNTQVIVTAAHAIAGKGQPGSLWLSDKELGIYTAEGILVIDELIPAGKKAMSGAAFLAGYRPV